MNIILLANLGVSSQRGVSRTDVIKGEENTLKMGVQFMQNVKDRVDFCYDSKAPSIVIEVKAYKDGYENIRKREGRIRAVTEITKDNLSYCKELTKLVNEFRHLDRIKGGLAVSESEFMATTDLKEAKPLTQVIYSNVNEVVEQGQYIFDCFWSLAIPAAQRIKEIEKGTRREFIQTIRDPREIQEIAFSLIKSATEEIMIIFSTANIFYHQEKEGMVQLLKEVAARDPHIKIRILVRIDKQVKKAVQKLREKNDNYSTDDQLQINTRVLKKSLKTKLTLLIVDKSFSLAIETKDTTKKSSYEAIGMASYSNSDSTVLSFASIFENIWIQAQGV